MFGFFPGSSPNLSRLKQMDQWQAEGRHDLLVPLFDEWLQCSPQLGVIWQGRGMSLLQLGRLQEAAASFEQARDRGGPGTESAPLMWADCLRQLARPEEAAALLEQELAGCRGSETFLRQMEVAQVQAYLQAGQAAAALATLQHYLYQGGPETPMIRLFQVEALARSGRLSEARPLLLALDDEEVAGVRHAMLGILEMPLVDGHPGLVDLACKLAQGVDPHILQHLNHVQTVHVQRHLGPVLEIWAAPESDTALLVLQPHSTCPAVRLVTRGLSAGTGVELMLCVPCEEWRNWAPELVRLAQRCGEDRRPLQSGQILPDGLLKPFAGVLLYPSISVSDSFYFLQEGACRTAFLALYPLYCEEIRFLESAALEDLLACWERHGIGELARLDRHHCDL
jgi:hypothetical protein